MSYDRSALLSDLFHNEILGETGAAGLYIKSAKFVQLMTMLDALILAAERPGTFEALVMPPQMPQRVAEMHEYNTQFPELLASVATEHTCSCSSDVSADTGLNSQLVLVPAVCHLLYPYLANRGEGQREPRGTYTVVGSVFRAEPSTSARRWQSFNVRDWVCVGTREDVDDFVSSWRMRWQVISDKLELAATMEIASDPFTGKTARVLEARQKQSATKIELVCGLDGEHCAVSSINIHGTHFTDKWKLRSNEALYVSACIGFGLERLALVLIERHGIDEAIELVADQADGIHGSF